MDSRQWWARHGEGLQAAAPPHMWKEQANPYISFLLSSWEDRGSS